MTMDMGMDYGALVPEAALLVGAIVALLAGSFLPRRRQGVVTVAAILASLVSVGAAIAAVVQDDTPRTIFEDSYALDIGSTVIRIAAPLATIVVLLIARPDLKDRPRESESVSLLMLATLGTVVLAGAHDLLIVAAAFFLASVPLYALIGLYTGKRGAEASLKTYLMGALLGVTMLLGIAVLAGVGGGSGYTQLRQSLPEAPAAAVGLGVIAIFAGLMFKVGAVPGHFWVPDAAQGSSISVAAFVTTVPKIGALVAVARLVEVVQPAVSAGLVIAVFAAVTMVLGTLAALWQDDVRRLLGWSTVSQAGFLLMPAAAIGSTPGAIVPLLVYAVFYAATNLAAFAVVAALPDRVDLASWRGAGSRHPLLVGALIVSLLSVIGTPPTLVFVGKLSVFVVAAEAGLVWLVIVAIAVSVASVFYALRWIVPAVRPAVRPAGGGGDVAVAASDVVAPAERAPRLPAAVALVLAVLVVAAGATALPLLSASPMLVGAM
ncbi:NADH-quinone oxidoreductase subunit N [Microbacterium sp. SCN 69-37]|uniref:NADH-quinone oxidoreductase subunit N n=1 Tax=Microbacterium sp. SCN 69-37 TaxID=1660115 RepID=UPI0025F24284|nr:NADH-quinone oxidoreductase subunit N [Microbacterium sp. SCN 69-37]